MKLYHLRRIPPLSTDYDTTHELLIRAPDEAWARSAAMLACASEDYYGEPPWQDASKTSCEQLTADGPAEVVIKHVING